MVGSPDDQLKRTIEQSAERWAEDLIDLSPRTNTLLSFEPGRGTKIGLTEAAPEVLTGFLAGDRVRLSQLFPDPVPLAKLLTQFRTLRTKSKQLKEEQGVDALRVALGALGVSSRATHGKPVTLRCPLLLASVVVESSSAIEKD